MHGLPVAAAVSELLSLLQQCLHLGAANAGAVRSINSVGEPRARRADLLAELPLNRAVVSVASFLHCQHRFPASIDVLEMKWREATWRLSVIESALKRGHARTSRYVWTNPLQRSVSADGGQNNTSLPKLAVFGDEAVSDVCVSVAPP